MFNLFFVLVFVNFLIPERLRRGILTSDYKKVSSEYEALDTPEARNAYVRERRKIMAEIENVGRFDTRFTIP